MKNSSIIAMIDCMWPILRLNLLLHKLTMPASADLLRMYLAMYQAMRLRLGSGG